PQVRLVHVHRANGAVVLADMPPITRDQLDDLGLRPNDHLLFQRTVLLVEGVHDQWVIERFVGDELRRQRVWTIPLHGGRNPASALDANVLLDFTDARIVVALDKLDADEIGDMWNEVRLKLASEGLSTALDALTDRLPTKKAEDKFLYDLCRRALEEGVH